MHFMNMCVATNNCKSQECIPPKSSRGPKFCGVEALLYGAFGTYLVQFLGPDFGLVQAMVNTWILNERMAIFPFFI